MEYRRNSPSPEKMYIRQDYDRNVRLGSSSNTPDIVANTTDNTSSDDIYYDEPTNSTNTSLVTTPVCCIDSKSHYLPPPPSHFPTKLNANSYPICDIHMQSLPSVPQHHVIYANTPSNNGDNWQNRTQEVPIVTIRGRSVVTMPKPSADHILNPNDMYAKVDKTRKKYAIPKKTAPPTYANTEEIATMAVVSEPKKKETKVTVEKTSPVDPDEIPNEIPNTNIAVAFVVTCCFNIPFGTLAIYCSLIAAKSFRDGNIKAGERRSQCSIVLSLFGILVTVLVVMGCILHLAMPSADDKKKLGRLSKQNEFNL